MFILTLKYAYFLIGNNLSIFKIFGYNIMEHIRALAVVVFQESVYFDADTIIELTLPPCQKHFKEMILRHKPVRKHIYNQVITHNYCF